MHPLIAVAVTQAIRTVVAVVALKAVTNIPYRKVWTRAKTKAKMPIFKQGPLSDEPYDHSTGQLKKD
ncbi:MAG: hypothetical protein JKY34_08705 [Kordiimonadaceae bacterium]|nr:hypothetical protein [Kordiimonadaceae bacterium]